MRTEIFRIPTGPEECRLVRIFLCVHVYAIQDMMKALLNSDMKKKTTFRFTTLYVIVMSVLLLLTNAVLGAVLMRQSRNAVTELVRKSMLNIVSTAADIVDGDRLGSLKETDVRDLTVRRQEQNRRRTDIRRN